MSMIKNIIIFLVIAAAIFAGYYFFFRPEGVTPSLVSSAPGASPGATVDKKVVSQNNILIAEDFLALLLNVKTIKLDDAVFLDPVFQNLRDSSITLMQDGTEGRPNPFAKLGSDAPPPAPAPAPETPPITENEAPPETVPE